jgi:predicted lipoprotein with Yx(FWY)xxD motif
MQRTHIFLAVALAGVVSVSAAAGAQGIPAAHAARAAKVTLRHTRLGNILATSSGFTLYEFTRDHSRSNSCVRISGCS